MFNYDDLLFNKLNDNNNGETEEGEYNQAEIQVDLKESNQENKKSKKKQKKKAKKKALINVKDNNLTSLVCSNENSKICIFSNNLTSTLYCSKFKVIYFNTDEDLFRNGKMNILPDNRAIDIPKPQFWHNRYYYFSRFDDGITMDFESWYSVTPEELAIYIAEICKGKSVIDAFCGCGGNTIQFSKYCTKVYSIDIDPKKIALTRSNSKVYQCSDNITFICEDFLKIESYNIKADYVFISPPWGGIDYKDQEEYSLIANISPNIIDIIKISLKLSGKFIFYLPRNSSIDEFSEIISKVYKESNLNEESFIFLDIQMLNSANKVKAILIIIGDEMTEKITIKDIRNYLKSKYKALEEYQLCELINIYKIISLKSFLLAEYSFSSIKIDQNTANQSVKSKAINLIKYLKDEVMTSEQQSELKSIRKKEKKEKKVEKEPYYLFYHDSGRILTKEEYESLINNII